MEESTWYLVLEISLKGLNFFDYRRKRYHGTLKEVFRMASVRLKSSGPPVVTICGLFVKSLSMFVMS
jgi:hypothetical protein